MHKRLMKLKTSCTRIVLNFKISQIVHTIKNYSCFVLINAIKQIKSLYFKAYVLIVNSLNNCLVSVNNLSRFNKRHSNVDSNWYKERSDQVKKLTYLKLNLTLHRVIIPPICSTPAISRAIKQVPLFLSIFPSTNLIGLSYMAILLLAFYQQ